LKRKLFNACSQELAFPLYGKANKGLTRLLFDLCASLKQQGYGTLPERQVRSTAAIANRGEARPKTVEDSVKGLGLPNLVVNFKSLQQADIFELCLS